MPAWLAVALLLVTILLVLEVVSGLRAPTPTIVLRDRAESRSRRVWPLRFIAALALIVAWGQREIYELHPDWIMDALTTVFLILALSLVVISWRIARSDSG
jgi:hypothetical protein